MRKHNHVLAKRGAMQQQRAALLQHCNQLRLVVPPGGAGAART